MIPKKTGEEAKKLDWKGEGRRSSTGKERGGSPSKQARKSVPSNPVSKKEEPEVQSGAGSEVIGQPGEEVRVKEGLSEEKKAERTSD